ncbi:pyruvate carboxylase [Luteolibacter sp. SL250]|uniref:pyruvate carboxylase n=1 Tax=Luteolibacter sp. SL250 TaxID=2995170 RepID=UPI00226FDF32|nr:pyruvate carboxylase [Luteolibacter sp. SL250]WAC18312.1 pyruvate carboxylase [Luteolibacter sp. SL250]
MLETQSNPGKLMAANRGEIAIRIFRAANELGLRTVSIFAEEDRFSIHRFKADEAYQLDSSKGPVGAYLDVEGIVKLAKSKGVTMIHPGYGFLSENAAFARACAREGITFIGPSPELLENMGDKTAARQLAEKFKVPTLPGTEEPITDPDQALTVAHEIGFPLIIKAAFGGGGRGMRVVDKPSQLPGLLAEAQNEALNAFGNAAVFLERYISRAKHIEVQILGDQHGNVVHLFERDCSVQRRYQKVVEVAPAVNLDPKVRKELCDAAVSLAKGIGYNNAGTVEFLYDMDKNDWFFIEMNPRIQVEHTVTECVTGIDLVRSQILVSAGNSLFGDEIAIPQQDQMPCNGFAIQCRVTTEDPEKNFAPDYGRILNYRSAAGFGIRLDAASGDAGSVVTPYYDSMLVKVTAMGRSFPIACQRMDRALREFRIRGVKTNIPFLENVIEDETFRTGQAHTKLIDTKTSLFNFKIKRDRATRTLAYLSDITINGNPSAKNWRPPSPLPSATIPAKRGSGFPADKHTKHLLTELGPEKFTQWILDQKRLLITDTSMRDAHQSLIATRMRGLDMLNIAETYSSNLPQLFSLENWGGATFDTAMRFLSEDPWERLRQLREKVPNILFQMLFRGSNAVGYSNYPDNVVAGFVKHAADSGMDIFRIFDSLNYLPNMKVAMEAVRGHGKVLCEAAICYTGDILDEKRDKYSLKYYVAKAKELEAMGAHILAIKDMAGLCKPQAAYNLVKALKGEIGIPIHFHTHDTSGLNAASVIAAARAGVDIADLALASLSGSTSQPNLNSVCAALANSEQDPGLDIEALNEVSDYWEEVLGFYKPFDSAPRAGTAEVYDHEMPGGQYTNLREQANAMGLGHRWREIARTYADVNQLFGDIVKVTPSSKVVGDMAMFLITRGIKSADVPKLKPGSIDWPESVIDMLSGGLGQPDGGWPVEVQKVVLGNKKATTKRPGELAEPIDLEATRSELTAKLGRDASDDDLYSHLMYPQVFSDFIAFRKKYDDLSSLPTSAFFYGLQIGEEIEVEIDPGKILIIKLISIGEPDSEGRRALFYELNGMPRESVVADKSLVSVAKASRPKGDPSSPTQACAPMPGMVTEVAVSAGQEVKAGDKLIVLEAMKMLTTVSASADGIVKEILVKKGDQVDSDDLLARLE